MRIGYHTGTYPRATDTYIRREVRALRALGADVRTFAVHRPHSDLLTDEDERAECASTTYLLPASAAAAARAHVALALRHPRRYASTAVLAARTRGPGARPLLMQAAYFVEAGLLARAVRRHGITHLHNHLADSSCTVAMLAADLADVPFSFTLHGPGIFFEPARWRLDEKLRRAAFVACISSFCRSQAMLLSTPDRWPTFEVVHCGVDAGEHTLSEHEPDSNRLLYVGRLAAAKGLPLLLECVRRLVASHPSVSLTIVGDGEERPVVERLIADLGLRARVELAGSLGEREVQAALTSADVFVLPSFAEGVPVSLMEAMAAGVPVVTTAVGGITELVEDGVEGWVVPPGEVEPLVERIGCLLDDAELRRAMGKAGRAKVESAFDSATEARRLHGLFLGAAGGGRP